MADVSFVNTDPTYYEQLLIDAYQNITNRKLYPGDPDRLLVDLQTYATALLAIAIDQTGKQNLLAYASGSNLDALAEFYGVTRLPAQPAQTTLQFSINQPLNFNVVIPAGTRATPDGKLFFATLQDSTITAGSTSVSVPAACQTPGSIGNGYAPGQINQLVDTVPYVTQVQNTTMSMYGTDPETDDRFRQRIRLSMERFSTAGPTKAYKYWTLTANQNIEDVEVFSPAPGQVTVVFTTTGGGIPDQDLINTVASFLSQDNIRPLTDQVSVIAPTPVYYNINVTYYINQTDSAKVSIIQNQVNQAVQDFINWTKSKIGRYILPEQLIARLKDAGAYMIDLTAPTKKALTIQQIAYASNITVNYGGLVND
jgi:phage-related baseplate assembly protein